MHYIIGGNDVTDRAEYPYVVSLQYLSTHVHFCGGSIINSHWVISAAHCHMPDAIGVAAGSIDRRFPTQFTEVGLNNLTVINDGRRQRVRCIKTNFRIWHFKDIPSIVEVLDVKISIML